MPQHRHCLIRKSPETNDYIYPRDGRGSKFKVPLRQNKFDHAQKLKNELNTAKELVEDLDRAGITLEFRGEPEFDLAFDSLDSFKANDIELMNVRHENNVVAATVYIPPGKLDKFFKIIERCSKETESIDGKAKRSPSGQNLFDSTSSIRLAAVQAFWTDNLDFPKDTEKTYWWEVWIRSGKTQQEHDKTFINFTTAIADATFKLGTGLITFPERLVLLVRGTVDEWSNHPSVLNLIAELRLAKEVPTDLVDLTPSEQLKWVDDAAARITVSTSSAPSICLLDTGVWRDHPLLRYSLDIADCHSVEEIWGTSDDSDHGTGMAGIVLFGEHLQDILYSNKECSLKSRLESVKILPPRGSNDPENYGYTTVEGVSRAEIRHPNQNRTICMAVSSDDRDQGYPSLWSSAIDDHAAGSKDHAQRLYILSTGNYVQITDSTYKYPQSNHLYAGIEDPGQSWNALTVGAYTNRVFIRSNDEFNGWRPVAPSGGLSPTSRTSMMWANKTWPLKPEIVMEGGNWAWDNSSVISPCTDLELLTTSGHNGRLLNTMRDTSSATAQAAKLASTLQAQYPNLRPETIRAIIVHSACWNQQMRTEFPGNDQETLQQLLRCYGYGVPDINRALWSVENQVSMIIQGELQPFKNVGSDTNKDIRANEIHFHTLPWPKEALEQISNADVTIRITLSYFVEPSPARRGWTNKFRYQSHGLRFKLSGPLEDSSTFRKRLSRKYWDDPKIPPFSLKEPQSWVLGAGTSDLSARGSIHSNWWTTSAAEIAKCNEIAVYPVTGWWCQRKHLNKFNNKTKYSLVVTIETPETNVDLYTPIANQIAVVPSISV